jgi:hypothetical protein
MGPQGLAADFSNGCVPIVISSDTVTSIYYYNDGRWLEYTERFN